MNAPTSPRIVVAFLLTVALVVPTVSAGIPLEGQFTATGVRAQGPHATKAPSVVFLQQHRSGIDSKAGSDFALTAKSLRVQTYSAEPVFHPTATDIAPTSQSSDEVYQDAVVQGLANRDGYRWYLFSPQEGNARIETAGTCSSLAPSSEAQVTKQSFVQYNAPDNTVTVSTADTLLWTDCSMEGAAITVSGTFLLMLWEWDAVVHANGQDHPLPSGRGTSSSDPVGSSETTSVVSHDRQRYLYVEDGTLTIPHLTGNNYAVYVGPEAHVDSEADLSVNGATGTLAVEGSGVELHDSRLAVTGQSQAVLSGVGVGRPFAAQLAGSPESVTVDGKTVMASSAIVPGPRTPWLWLAGAIGLVVAPASVVLLRRQRRRAPMRARTVRVEEQADDLAARLHLEEAEQAGLKVLDWQPTSPEAHERAGRVLGAQGDLQAALHHHEQAHRLLAPAQQALLVENSCGTALVLALLHARAAPAEQTALRDRIHACLREIFAADPLVGHELERHHELRPFLDTLDADSTWPSAA